MPGARCARSLACENKKHTSVVTTVTPETPGIPRAMVYGLYVLSPVIGLFDTVAGEIGALVPGWADSVSRRLDANH